MSFQFIYLYGSNILFSQNVKRSARDQIQFDSVDITENATRIYMADCNTDNVLSCKEHNEGIRNIYHLETWKELFLASKFGNYIRHFISYYASK